MFNAAILIAVVILPSAAVNIVWGIASSVAARMQDQNLNAFMKVSSGDLRLNKMAGQI